jgi:hypothetical protein
VRIIGRLGPQPQKVVDDLLKVPVKVLTAPVLLGTSPGSRSPAHARRREHRQQPGVVITIVKQPHADTASSPTP